MRFPGPDIWLAAAIAALLITLALFVFNPGGIK